MFAFHNTGFLLLWNFGPEIVTIYSSPSHFWKVHRHLALEEFEDDILRYGRWHCQLAWILHHTPHYPITGNSFLPTRSCPLLSASECVLKIEGRLKIDSTRNFGSTREIDSRYYTFKPPLNVRERGRRISRCSTLSNCERTWFIEVWGYGACVGKHIRRTPICRFLAMEGGIVWVGVVIRFGLWSSVVGLVVENTLNGMGGGYKWVDGYKCTQYYFRLTGRWRDYGLRK